MSICKVCKNYKAANFETVCDDCNLPFCICRQFVSDTQYPVQCIYCGKMNQEYFAEVVQKHLFPELSISAIRKKIEAYKERHGKR